MIDEEELIIALKSPNESEKAFRVLVDQYKERLYWHIRKIVLNHEDTDDILQNTFIKIYKNIHKFEGKSKLYTWIYRIATNESITFLNKNAKMKNITIGEVKNKLIENLESDIYFEGNQIQILFQKAINTLPQKQQLVFNMKYFEDHTYEDLSEILETSVGGLKSSYHIAVKKITAYIKLNETI
jgi:RNA polymerase sigma-70 factor (ECF subfamily)|tara:strand:- start:746 stop:1297 length:552 start_codon:yes stop_codon:yes gene_type:complete